MTRGSRDTLLEAAARLADHSLREAIAHTNQSTKGAMLLKRARGDGDRRGAPMPDIRGLQRPWDAHAFMTVPESADLLGVPEAEVRRLLRDGRLIGINFGGPIGWRVYRAYAMEVFSHNVFAAADDAGSEISP